MGGMRFIRFAILVPRRFLANGGRDNLSCVECRIVGCTFHITAATFPIVLSLGAFVLGGWLLDAFRVVQVIADYRQRAVDVAL
jgi:hypothetical protein